MDWKRFFDRLGLNGTHWQWKVIRWQERWADFKADLWGKKQTVTYRHKFCPECGALLDRQDKVCPQCESRVGSWQGQSLARALGFVIPTASIASPALVAANLAIMLLVVLRYGAPELVRPGIEVLYTMGALVPFPIMGEEVWRVITYGYLHIGLLHIAFNMVALSQVGPMLEREVGTARFFSVYTLALIAGGIADLAIRPMPWIVAGASGALFGLIGFGIAYCHFSGGSLREYYRGFFIKWAAYAFVIGFVIRADNIAHAGGFVMGALLGVVIERERRWKDRWTPAWKALALLCLALTIAAFAGLLLAGRSAPPPTVGIG
jgi:rhomboid protease GluP